MTRVTEDVSIPLWFDSNFFQHGSSLFFMTVSIPLWFDSNSGFERLLQADVECFNSTLVRFKRESPAIHNRVRWRFNSTLVRFKHL